MKRLPKFLKDWGVGLGMVLPTLLVAVWAERSVPQAAQEISVLALIANVVGIFLVVRARANARPFPMPAPRVLREHPRLGTYVSWPHQWSVRVMSQRLHYAYSLSGTGPEPTTEQLAQCDHIEEELPRLLEEGLRDLPEKDGRGVAVPHIDPAHTELCGIDLNADLSFTLLIDGPTGDSAEMPAIDYDPQRKVRNAFWSA